MSDCKNIRSVLIEVVKELCTKGYPPSSTKWNDTMGSKVFEYVLNELNANCSNHVEFSKNNSYTYIDSTNRSVNLSFNAVLDGKESVVTLTYWVDSSLVMICDVAEYFISMTLRLVKYMANNGLFGILNVVPNNGRTDNLKLIIFSDSFNSSIGNCWVNSVKYISRELANALLEYEDNLLHFTNIRSVKFNGEIYYTLGVSNKKYSIYKISSDGKLVKCEDKRVESKIKLVELQDTQE